MRFDGRDITVAGSLLQPLTRRTNDIVRLALATLFLAIVVTSSLITRNDWVGLEKSVSRIVGVLTPTQSNLVYLAYGIAILALPFMILVGLIAARQWKLLGAYAAAGVIAVLSLSITGNGIAAPRWHFDLSERLSTTLSQFLDDPRWIAMLAAVLTVSGPWLPARWRRWWWTLLLAFVPIHLVVSAVIPARSLLGLAVGWFVGALVVLVVGTPALEVPLDGAVRALSRRGFLVNALTVVRPAGQGPLELSATDDAGAQVVLEMYGPNQRGAGALRQFWRWLILRDQETAPLQASMRRAVEHRALMAIAVGDLGVANTTTMAVAALDRGWTLYAHTPPKGTPVAEAPDEGVVTSVWGSLGVLQRHGISHGDLRFKEITVDAGKALFGGFGNSEYGASDEQLQSDIAQLLVTTTNRFGAEAAVRAAVEVLGKDTVLNASRRLTKSAVPARLRKTLDDPKAVMTAARDEVKQQTGANEIKTETITRFTRKQVIQLVLLVALVYVAYPFIATVPKFFNELSTANWWWAVLGLAVSALTYVGAAAGTVGLRVRGGELPQRGHHAVRQHLRGHHHPGRRRRPGVEHPLPAEGRTGNAARHRCGGSATVGPGDHPRVTADLLQRRRRRIGRPVALRAECHPAVSDRRDRARSRGDVLVRTETAPLAGHGRSPETQGDRRRAARARPGTQAARHDRTRLCQQLLWVPPWHCGRAWRPSAVGRRSSRSRW